MTTLARRKRLAAALRASRETVARAATAEFLADHPDWLERYGELARVRGEEDALFHVDFLAAGIESGSARAFADYARWTAGVLEARGIDRVFVAENLDNVERALFPHLGSEDDVTTVASYLEAGRAALAEASASPAATGERPLALPRSLFLQAILAGERRAALGVVEESLRAGRPVLDVYADVLQEALYEVGDRWARNEITVAEEHMATAISQYVIGHIYAHLPPTVNRRGRAVITGVRGELHQVGPNIIADALEADGWDVRFLGTNVPHEGILEAVEEHRADVLGISTTVLFNVDQAVGLIEDARSRLGERAPRVVVGGRAFMAVPDLWREIAADGFAPGVREAVTLVRGLGSL